MNRVTAKSMIACIAIAESVGASLATTAKAARTLHTRSSQAKPLQNGFIGNPLIACIALAGFASIASGSEASQIESFTLPTWSEKKPFDLNDQSDSIIVLDFFAYWCVPCLQASRDLESNVDRYYESRQGNASGLPVKVVSINIERSFPEKTDAFIRNSGARFVLDDPGGEILAQLGGKALPFFAIIKKSDDTNATDAWDVLYQRSGYEGAESFRSLIDSIGPDNPLAESGEDSEAAQIAMDSNPYETKTESTGNTQSSDLFGTSYPQLITDTTEYFINSEILASSDISLQSINILRTQSMRNWDWDLNLTYGRIDVDYEPFTDADILGKSARLIESNGSLQASARFSRSTVLQYQFSAGGYYGYSDHRSLWLDEYYRQQFSRLSGYEFANPWGVNLSVGTQWDTQSPFGLLGVTLAAQQDDVAPGYDRPLFQALERGRERLDTGSILLEQESIISKNARMRNQVSATRTTDREMRYQYSGYLNLALSESWVLRTEGAATFEETEAEGESDFHSYSVGATAEYDWDQRLFLSFTGRKYRDNGQIETSILVSSGPPPLETTHFGAALRWQGERNAYKLSLASYRSRFDEVDSPIRPFGNLYTDRDWLLATVSLNRSF